MFSETNPNDIFDSLNKDGNFSFDIDGEKITLDKASGQQFQIIKAEKKRDNKKQNKEITG